METLSADRDEFQFSEFQKFGNYK